VKLGLLFLIFALPAFGAILGQINTRDNTLILKSSADGVLYSVKSKEGTMLAEDISETQLKSDFPQLHDFVKSGVALDASVRKEYLKPVEK
jgi:hypothetical protein